MMWIVFLGGIAAILGSASAKTVCCESLMECFTDEAPFSDFPLPSCPEDIGETFVFYDRADITTGIPFLRNEVPTGFSPSRRTVILTHGWHEDGERDYLMELKDAMLQKDDYNVILVSWAANADSFYYPKAATNTRTVGAEVAWVVDHLVVKTQARHQNFWCVGFSLGAHVCGHMGMRTKSKIGRVTGLDPTGMLFDKGDDRTVGLNPTSGEFVDVIHTDGKGMMWHVGLLNPLGHMDFYPNKGSYQPGCMTRRKRDAGQQEMTLATKNDAWSMSCSAYRAVWYFLETIQEDPFCHVAKSKCSDEKNMPGSCEAFGSIRMGYHAEENIIPGLYYLETNSRAPYCKT